MIEQGLVEEVRDLMKMGYGLHLPSMSSLGYKQIGMFLEGKLELATAIQQIKYETHRFARHQYAWFPLQDERIHWFDVRDDFEGEVWELVERFVLGGDQRAG
jgi:tRNA dimethylallyltransferase